MRAVPRIFALALALPIAFSAGTASAQESTDRLATADQAIVYGSDDRQDLYAYTTEPFATLARESSVTIMFRSSIDASNAAAVGIYAASLGDANNLCDGERFASQPSAGYCSGTLIAPDLVLTAGHCVSEFSCPRIAMVFNFSMTSANSIRSIPLADVFTCSGVIARVENSNADYAVIQLDRPATPRFSPAPVRSGLASVQTGDPLVMIGSPSGIPLKVEDGGRVRTPQSGNYIVATTDSFGGNSGSGVYDADTGDLIGVLTAGDTDYVRDGRCYVVNQCSESGCGGEQVFRASVAIGGLCNAATDEELCNSASVCGDGFCAFDERGSCSDCAAASCGDGVCNINEWNTCDSDCGNPVPAGWECQPEYYGTGDGCDCDCGSVEDPDCSDPDQEQFNCDTGLCSAASRGVKADEPFDRYWANMLWLACAGFAWSVAGRRRRSA
jgi:V8-like Glu-specific endopeptidase